MHSFLHRSRIPACCSMILLFLSAAVAQAAMDPSLEIDPRLLEGFRASARPAPKAGKPPGKHSPPGKAGLRRTRGAHRRGPDRTLAGAHRIKGDLQRLPAAGELAGDRAQSLRLESPSAIADQESALQMSEFWKKLMPASTVAQKPLSFQSASFSLTIDPLRYPVYSAMNGARIVVDRNAGIPPLVRSLIVENDPTVRFISESPVNSRKFLSAMLEAAGFYSVEENFVMEFGADPKLKVHADFKVEKTPESLLKQDVILLNSAGIPFPKPLVSFLEQQGFTPLEPFASPKHSLARPPVRQLRQISAANRSEMIDALLATLAVPFRSDYPVDVFSSDNNGISLSVKAERYYERDGQRCVLTGFDGDPVTYTLFRILETKGFRVVILDGKDDFRKASEKVLASLHLPASYTRQEMWPDNGSGYSLSMSGFRLEGAGVPGGSLFLTDLHLDRIIRDLLVENGYDVQAR